MSDEHLGFHDFRSLERGKKLTDEQRRHLNGCYSCRFYLKVDRDTWWKRLLGAITGIFSKKKDAR